MRGKSPVRARPGALIRETEAVASCANRPHRHSSPATSATDTPQSEHRPLVAAWASSVKECENNLGQLMLDLDCTIKSMWRELQDEALACKSAVTQLLAIQQEMRLEMHQTTMRNEELPAVISQARAQVRDDSFRCRSELNKVFEELAGLVVLVESLKKDSTASKEYTEKPSMESSGNRHAETDKSQDGIVPHMHEIQAFIRRCADEERQLREQAIAEEERARCDADAHVVSSLENVLCKSISLIVQGQMDSEQRLTAHVSDEVERLKASMQDDCHLSSTETRPELKASASTSTDAHAEQTKELWELKKKLWQNNMESLERLAATTGRRIESKAQMLEHGMSHSISDTPDS